MRTIVVQTLRIGFVIGVVALAWFNLPVAIIAIIAVALTILHGKANSLIEFSFGPLKAKLEREISDAEKLVEKLRNLAVFQAKAAVTGAIRGNRWGSSDDVWQFENVRHFEKALLEIGASDSDLNEMRADMVLFALIDAGNSATGGGTVPSHLSLEAQQAWSAIRDSQGFQNPEIVASWLRQWDELTLEREALIEDMRWIKTNKNVRDVDQYLRTQKTIEWSQ